MTACGFIPGRSNLSPLPSPPPFPPIPPSPPLAPSLFSPPPSLHLQSPSSFSPLPSPPSIWLSSFTLAMSKQTNQLLSQKADLAAMLGFAPFRKEDVARAAALTEESHASRRQLLLFRHIGVSSVHAACSLSVHSVARRTRGCGCSCIGAPSRSSKDCR